MLFWYISQGFSISQCSCFSDFYDPSNCSWILIRWKWVLFCIDESMLVSVCVCVCVCNLHKITVQECIQEAMNEIGFILLGSPASLCLQWVWFTAIVWKQLYTPSCTKSPIMSKHNKNTIIYMFSRLTRTFADTLLERKCAATLEKNGSCVFTFVCETTVVVLIPHPDLMLHWSWNYPSTSDPALTQRLELNVEK